MKRIIYLSLVALILSSCVSWTPKLTRATFENLEDAALENVVQNGRITLQGYYEDGSSIEFKQGWTVMDTNVVRGEARRRNVHGVLRDQDFKITELSAEDIVLWRTSRMLEQSERAVFLGSFLLVAMDAGVGVYCLSNPKDCFGSCPTFYQGESDHLFKSDAEGFTHAITPSLEHADIDALPELMSPGEEYLTMKNEALETHNIRSVELLAVPYEQGSSVMHTVDDAFYRVREGVAVEVRDTDGPVSLVQERDNLEWYALASPDDLAEKMELVLDFQPKPGVRYGLQCTYRQTLMSTYLFYGTLEAMGQEYGRRMVQMDHSAWQKHWLLKGGIMQYLGGIDVHDSKGRTVGAFEETGPIAPNTQLLVLGELDGPLTLELTKGLWRIDHIALVEILEEVQPTVHVVNGVDKNGVASRASLEALTDADAHLVSLPGEQWTLYFESVPEPSHVFLRSQGYYHEWSRTTWNDPGNIDRLEYMITHPRKFLREEAQAYKLYESDMEPLFWASKIQTPILTSYEK